MLKECDLKKEQKYCAAMLGMTQSKYNESLKNIKVSHFSKKRERDNVLSNLGLTKKYLKKKVQ